MDVTKMDALTPSEVAPQPPQEPTPRVAVLYVDGHRVPCDRYDIVDAKNGVDVTVTFYTTKNCLAVGDGDPQIERSWGGKSSGEMWFVRQPHPAGGKYPRSGCVIILDVVIPSDESQEVQYRCQSNTPIVDWAGSGNLHEANEEVLIPASWIEERA